MKRSFFVLLCLVFLGLLFHAGMVLRLPHETWPENQLFKPIQIRGWVETLPKQSGDNTRFLFQTPQGLLQLNWYGKPPVVLLPGQAWQLTVKLKPPRGLINPGLPNTALKQKREGVLAVGYVYHNDQHLLNTNPWRDPVNFIRAQLRERLLALTQGFSNQGVLLALTLGDQSGITQPQWQVFRNTGTNHLVAIAGLHMGIICGFIWLLLRWTWGAFSALAKRCPAQSAAWVASLITGFLYAALAGFSIPTQRALIMLLCFGSLQLLRKLTSPLSGWLLALLLVLLWNPWSVFDAGTWLSFGAVALLIYCCAGRVGRSSYWNHWVKPQWILSVGLIPFTAFWFGQVSWMGCVANIMAIPWLTFLLLPWLLLAVILAFPLPVIAHGILWLCQFSLNGLMAFLNLVGRWHFAAYYLPPTSWFVALLAAIGCFWLLAPKSIPCRYLGVILLLPLFLRLPSAPPENQVWLTVLDVGQGLATVIQTHSHTLVYDTGPSSPDGFNAGEAVVLPYLRYQGIQQLDKLVVSHGDNDHSGGAQYLIDNFPVKSFETSVPKKFAKDHAKFCLSNESWIWDGVQFEYLNTGNQETGNNRSCVLKVTADNQSILLPGDIEKPAEEYLVMFHRAQLPSTTLVAPHHGSKTSSSPDFVKAVDPKIVIFSTGFHNRFHFPNPEVMRRYQAIQAKLMDTAKSGGILVTLS